MVRAPCCDKMGLNKGPWSPEEDQILVSYIQKYGHANWRALPKQAGLLRCGKSCRLRWINYLRPDIKRGNFTKEEEETIINLHQILGNRWSAIAARLPGRTDNEIKNVWHTHLKKMHHHHHHHHHSKRHSISKSDCSDQTATSPHRCSSEISTVTDSSLIVLKKEAMDYSSADIPTIDESFWSEEDETKIKEDISYLESLDDSKVDDSSMDYWYNVFIRAGDMPDLPEF